MHHRAGLVSFHLVASPNGKKTNAIKSTLVKNKEDLVVECYSLNRTSKENIKNILVVAPGFRVDCLETIEEIDEENKEIFIEAGGEIFNYAPCLNDSQLHISFIKTFLIKQIAIWK